jgi:hypothetical protein
MVFSRLHPDAVIGKRTAPHSLDARRAEGRIEATSQLKGLYLRIALTKNERRSMNDIICITINLVLNVLS